MNTNEIQEIKSFPPANVEVFYRGPADFQFSRNDGSWREAYMNNAPVDWEEPADVALTASKLSGYYFWFCFSGCLPEGDPQGPYKTLKLAIAASWDENWQEDDGQPD